MVQGSLSGELLPIKQSERPVTLEPSEVKAQEKPIGQGEQKIIERIDRDGNPDKVLKDIAANLQESGTDVQKIHDSENIYIKKIVKQ